MIVVKCTPEQRNHIDATCQKFFRPFHRIRNPETQEPGEVKFLLVESEIQNAAQGVWNTVSNI